MNFLKTAMNAQAKLRGEKELDAANFLRTVRAAAKELNISEDMPNRPLNVGFSGGEKKRNETLQMALLKPKLRDPRRDGFRPRHRRAETGGRGRQQIPDSRPLASWSSPITSACSTISSPT